MSALNLSIPHQLPKEEALSRIKHLLENLKEEKKDMITNLQEEWQDDQGKFSFKAMGFDLSGNIQVNPGSVEINSQLPMAVSFFKGKIASIIQDKAAELLK